MTDVYHHQGGQVMPPQHHHQQQQQYWSESRVHQVAKAATAVAAGLSLLVLAGLTFVGTVIALMVATPLMVIFSPVLVPAAITLFLLAAGFLASGVFGIAAALVFTWMYKYASTGEHPRFAESMDQATQKLGSKAREFWDNTAGGGAGAGAGGGRSYRTNETRSYK